MNLGVVRQGFAADESLSEVQRIEKYSFHSIPITRLAYVRRLGDCAKKIGREHAERKLLPLLPKLQKDSEKDVRSALAEQLGELAKILSTNHGKTSVQKSHQQKLAEVVKKLKESENAFIRVRLSLKLKSPHKGGLFLKVSQSRDLLHETEIVWEGKEITSWTEFKIPFNKLKTDASIHTSSTSKDKSSNHDEVKPLKIVCWTKDEKEQKTSDFLAMVMIDIARLLQIKPKSTMPFCNRFGGASKDIQLTFDELEFNPPLKNFLEEPLPLLDEKTNKGDSKAITHKIIPCIQKLLLDEDQIVRNKACDALVKVASVLDEDQMQTNVLTVVLLLAHDENEKHKTVASKLLSSLASILGPLLCSEFCAPELVHLADDPKCSVRKAAVSSFGNVAKIAGAEITKKKLLPAFQQVAKDQVWSVRKSVVEQLVLMAGACKSEETAGFFTKLFEQFASDASRWVRNSAFEVLGRLIFTLGEHADQSLLNWFVKIPSLASTKIDQECTFFCAYNFPAVFQTMGVQRHPEMIQAFQQLTKDSRFPVRRALACSLHELAHMFGTDLTERHLMAPFNKFLRDATNEVREGVLSGMCHFLSKVRPSRREPYLSETWNIVRNSKRNWRFREIIARQLSGLSRIFSLKSTMSSLSSLVFYLCRDEVATVRKIAAMSVPYLLLRIYRGTNSGDELLQTEQDAEQDEKSCVERCKQALIDIKSFAESKTYKERQLFVYMTEALLTASSDNKLVTEIMVKTGIKSLMANLPNDKIINVKITFCEHVLPRFRKGEQDVFNADEIAKIRAQLETASDGDVKSLIKRSHEVELQRSNDILLESIELLIELKRRYAEQVRRDALAALDKKAPPAPQSRPPPDPSTDSDPLPSAASTTSSGNKNVEIELLGDDMELVNESDSLDFDGKAVGGAQHKPKPDTPMVTSPLMEIADSALFSGTQEEVVEEEGENRMDEG